MSEEEKDVAQLAKELASKLGGVEKTLDALAEKQRVHLHSMLWAQFAAGAIAQNGRSVQYATGAADEMLEAWISRFEERTATKAQRTVTNEQALLPVDRWREWTGTSQAR